MTIRSLRTPEERFKNLEDWPFDARYLENLPGFEGLRMHYVDEGPKDAEVTFLCLHGMPTWSYVYRKMMPIFLNAGHRVVAVDLFGFGRSDKPIDESAYSFYFHRNALSQLVETLDLKNICLTCQEWGGLIGLTLPLDAPSRYTHLIAVNTMIPLVEDLGPGFAAWRTYSRSNPDLDIGALMRRTSPKMSVAERDAYIAPFPDRSYKAGIRRFPEMVMVDGGESEGLDAVFAAFEFWSQRWRGKSFLAVGMKDYVLGFSHMRKLQETILGAPPLMELKEMGHYIEEDSEPVAKAALEYFGLE